MSECLAQRQGIAVIRHGHREPFQPRSFGNNLGLTAEGRESSFSLGANMAHISFGEMHTSPILRCLETTEEILKGLGKRVDIFKTQVLGDPGPFIEDPILAGPIFLEKSLSEIVQAIVNGERLPGMRSLQEGGYIFLKYLSQVKRFPCLMVSHDSLICLLCCFFFESKNVDVFMPNFLEGFFLSIEEKQLSIQFQHMSVVKDIRSNFFFQ